MHKQNEKLNKGKVTIKKTHKQTEILELSNTMAELKNSIERFNITLDQAEERQVTWKVGHLKLSSHRSKKEKE